jgi:hypothetical protein
VLLADEYNLDIEQTTAGTQDKVVKSQAMHHDVSLQINLLGISGVEKQKRD